MNQTGHSNMLPYLLLLLVSVGLGSCGQLLMKSGLSQLPDGSAKITIILSIFQNARVFGGFLCYGASSLIWLIVIKALPLSYAYPMVALSYVLVVGLSWKLLGETVPPLRIVALAIILIGVVMLAFSEDPDSGKQSNDPVAIHQAQDLEDADAG